MCVQVVVLRICINYDQTLQNCTYLRATTTYHLNKTCDLFGRVENALNRHYQQPPGYMQPGLAAYVGVRITT